MAQGRQVVRFEDKVVVITGAANGIGASIAEAFHERGVRAVALLDIDFEQVARRASTLGQRAFAVRCDVSDENSIQQALATVIQRVSKIDVYISNAGVLGRPGGFDLSDDVWSRMWQVHGMAHVWAARAVVPTMLERGEGYFVVTASAAGLLNIVESAPYGVTKHAAVAFAEWLKIAYGRQGLRVSCICPQLVDTGLVSEGQAASAGMDGLLSPRAVADELLRTMAEESFLCLPHPEVADYVQAKAQNLERWFGGMQRLRAAFVERSNGASPGGRQPS